jgi:multiple sugar transport system permease protein
VDPRSPDLGNFALFFQQANIGRLFFNSAYVAIAVTLIQLFTASLAAYTFAKRRFPGRDALFILTLGTMMIPGQVTLIPTYIILKQIPFFGGNDWLGQGGHGWLDSYWG